MINEPVITIGGNLTGDPELRFTSTGQACANFSVAANPRVRAASGEWEDGETVFYKVTAWRNLAENIAESLRRGDPVIVIGRIRANVWEDRDGNKRRDNVVTADSVSVPLDRHRVRLVKVTREAREAPPAAGDDWTARAASPEPASQSGPEPAQEPASGPGAAGPAPAGNGSAARSGPDGAAPASTAPAGAGRSRRGRARTA